MTVKTLADLDMLPPAESAAILYQSGVKYVTERKFNQAITCFNKLLTIAPKNVGALNNLGWCYYKKGMSKDAMTFYRKAHRIAEDNADALMGFANCYTAQGDFDKAETYYKKAFAKDPSQVSCLFRLTSIRDYPVGSWIAQKLQDICQSPGNLAAESRVQAYFALARIYDAAKEYKQAFQYYQEANTLLKSIRSPYNDAVHLAFFIILESFFNEQFFANLKNIKRSEAAPIFVLGMPRSGTSLVEQILASHSAVAGAGELSTIGRIVESYLSELTKQPYPQMLTSMSPELYNALAQFYLEEVNDYNPYEKAYVVDKMPANFFHIGMIHALFPNARIIHCVRDPMDTCWSIYRQYFSGPHPYAYEQTTLGIHYCRYQRLMRHWHKVLPGKIFDVRYEDLVAEPEPIIRNLLQYCQLEWEESCLSFHKTKRDVNTASLRQVRTPLYKKAIKSWAPLAEELEPLHTALQPAYAALGK